MQKFDTSCAFRLSRSPRVPYLATPVILVYHTLHFTFPRHVPKSRGPSEGNTTQSVAMSHPGALCLERFRFFLCVSLMWLSSVFVWRRTLRGNNNCVKVIMQCPPHFQDRYPHLLTHCLATVSRCLSLSCAVSHHLALAVTISIKSFARRTSSNLFSCEHLFHVLVWLKSVLSGTVFQDLTDWRSFLWWGLGTVGSLEFVFGKERWAVRFRSRHTALCARKPLWNRLVVGLWAFARTELQRADTIGDGSSDSHGWYESTKNTTEYSQKRTAGDELCTAVETPSWKVKILRVDKRCGGTEGKRSSISARRCWK